MRLRLHEWVLPAHLREVQPGCADALVLQPRLSALSVESYREGGRMLEAQFVGR